jgi:hypothetical protein
VPKDLRLLFAGEFSGCIRKANDSQNTFVTLTTGSLFVILPRMPQDLQKSRKYRPPRIRVPHQQKAIFTVENQKLVGVVQRLSSTGGSALLAKGPVPKGTLGEVVFGTIFGKVNAHIEFLHTGAEGVRLAQAFVFLTMDTISSQNLERALDEMVPSDLKQAPMDAAVETLRHGIRQLAGMLNSVKSIRSKS